MHHFLGFLVFVFISKVHETNAVAGGDPAEAGQFKYTVAVEMGPCSLCAGAIIDETHILTAAHCTHDVEAKDIIIVAGVTNTLDEVEILRAVEEIHEYPGYKPTTTDKVERMRLLRHFQCLIGRKRVKQMLQNDIAVLTLVSALPLENNIAKVELPASDELPYGEEGYFAGWGLTSLDGEDTYDLQYGKTKFLTAQQCAARYVEHNDNQFCAMDDDLCAYPLPGDSGCPLVHNNVVYGLLSHSRNTPYVPAVFTKVYSFKSFIQGVIDNDRLSNQTSTPALQTTAVTLNEL